MATGRKLGVISFISGTTSGIADIIVESDNIAKTVETAIARNEKGKVINHEAYSKTTTISANGLLNTDAPTIDAGSVIVVTGGTFLVTSAEQVEQNTDFVRYNLTMEKHDDCIPTAYSAGA